MVRQINGAKRKRPTADTSKIVNSEKENEGKQSSNGQAASSSKRFKPSPRTALKKEDVDFETLPSAVSNLRTMKDDEVSFPRGGGTGLTPLEYKEVSNQAVKDILFDADGRKSGASLEPKDVNMIDEFQKKKPTKPRVDWNKKKGKIEAPKEENSAPKIEGLSYKRLIPGTIVLGRISQVNATDIAVSLPNNLTGFVPSVNISDKLTKKIEALVHENTSDEESNGEVQEQEQRPKPKSATQNEDATDLTKYFRVGQYIRAYVVRGMNSILSSASSMDKAKHKKHIELSLKPSLVNSGVVKMELVVGCAIQASVSSVEDYGLVMDLGLDDPSISGFLGSNELGGMGLSDIQEGAVMLCQILGLSPNGKVLKLSADIGKPIGAKLAKGGSWKGGIWLNEVPSVNALTPGTGVELLVTEVGWNGGVLGKIMGMVDGTIDFFHAGGWGEAVLEERVKAGSKIHARVIFTCPGSEPKKLGLSILPHILSMQPNSFISGPSSADHLMILPIATILDAVKVQRVEPKLGLFIDVGVPGTLGFVHISRISSEKKIEDLQITSGPYKIGSVHQARVLSYNYMDGLYICSMESKILQQRYLRVDDIQVGEVCQGKVMKFLQAGVILVELSEGIVGYVEEMHLSDVKLKNPEKKFREGMEVKCRVLKRDLVKKRLTLTLKKTLVNSDAPVIKSYEEATPGVQTPGTIVSLRPTGAIVSFYGGVTAYLPLHEMSEASIHDPREHFRIGQSIQVHVVSVGPEHQRMRVSCKDPNSFGEAQILALQELRTGAFVSGTVVEKSNDDCVLELQNVGASGIKGLLTLAHFADSKKSTIQAFRNTRAGQTLRDVLVIKKDERRRLVSLTLKPSLVSAAKEGTLLMSFDDVKEGKLVYGYVKKITMHGILVEFAAGLTGFINKTQIPADKACLPDFSTVRGQSLTATIIYVNHDESKFYLTLNHYEPKVSADRLKPNSSEQAPGDSRLVSKPIDPTIKTVEELLPGKILKVKVTSVRETQINVQLAENIQGRIDVSQVFDRWEDIRNKKRPLDQFQSQQTLNAKIIGIHDARNHKFLPITHRSTRKTPIFELSVKPSEVNTDKVILSTLGDLKEGQACVAFVNNHTPDCVWVNLSPALRGRINLLDLSDDPGLIFELHKNFPLGCALRCHILKVDPQQNRLDLTARTSRSLTFEDLSIGMILPGKVTKTTDRSAYVQLGENLSGTISLTDIADDFSEALPIPFERNQIMRVCVIDINRVNKRVALSTRRSRVLSSSLIVRDPEILVYSDLKPGDIRRGFVKNVADQGLFVSFGHNVIAFVPVRELSDLFLKDWKSEFQVDQLVTGKVLSMDADISHIKVTLKKSIVSGEANPVITLSDLRVGQIVNGKVRSVADFGVFVVVEGSANVSGLCHISEVADTKTEPSDLKQFYSTGDKVKAKILSVDQEKRRISFGLKASYFADDCDEKEKEAESDDESEGGVVLVNEEVMDVDQMDNVGCELKDEYQGHDLGVDSEVEDAPLLSTSPVLKTNGFDWTGNVLDSINNNFNATSSDSDVSDFEKANKPRRKKKPKIKQDLTLDLATREPQSVADFERLLMGNPQSSETWVRYMAFQLKFSEVEKVREIADRALKTITSATPEGLKEKENVWVAMLNLELEYGTEENLEEVFKQACNYNDAQDMTEKMCDIYVQAGRIEKANALFRDSSKKFSQSPRYWIHYFTFLFNNANPDTSSSTPYVQLAREILSERALKALPVSPPSIQKHLLLKFSLLEFNSPYGDPERGRTLLENLLNTYIGIKSKGEIATVWTDAEIKLYNTTRDATAVRALFQRILSIGKDNEKPKLKPRLAKLLFKKWLEFESKNGRQKDREEVTKLARDFAQAAASSKLEKEVDGEKD